MSARTVYYPSVGELVQIRSYARSGERWVVLEAPGISVHAAGDESVACLKQLAAELLAACDAAQGASVDVNRDITSRVLDGVAVMW